LAPGPGWETELSVSFRRSHSGRRRARVRADRSPPNARGPDPGRAGRASIPNAFRARPRRWASACPATSSQAEFSRVATPQRPGTLPQRSASVPKTPAQIRRRPRCNGRSRPQRGRAVQVADLRPELGRIGRPTRALRAAPTWSARPRRGPSSRGNERGRLPGVHAEARQPQSPSFAGDRVNT